MVPDREQMRVIADIFDQAFNGEPGSLQYKIHKIGFILMVFQFNEGTRCHYISNANRDDAIAVMQAQIDSFEEQAAWR
jgi:hypothetical protein